VDESSRIGRLGLLIRLVRSSAAIGAKVECSRARSVLLGPAAAKPSERSEGNVQLSPPRRGFEGDAMSSLFLYINSMLTGKVIYPKFTYRNYDCMCFINVRSPSLETEPCNGPSRSTRSVAQNECSND